MSTGNPTVIFEPVLDSPELAEANRRTLNLDRGLASTLGHEVVRFIGQGGYRAPSGRFVDLTGQAEVARNAKVSIRPDATLPVPQEAEARALRISVRNQTSLQAARELLPRPLVLNFANSRTAGGGFLAGARAQEECLVRSSWLYATLPGDPFYDYHRQNDSIRASDWAILSPEVPVFRNEDGTLLEEPWLCDFLTCAAPVASRLTDPQEAATLMGQRIERVLAIAHAYGYERLVLGAWGCGAFHNDPVSVASQFRAVLLGSYQGAFSQVIFAITDWSPERRFLGPFREAFQ